MISRLLAALGLLSLLVLVGGAAALLLAGYWLAADDEPVKADGIVVLAGSYLRPQHAADLYTRGYAPVVYVSRPMEKDPSQDILREVGVEIPSQHEINLRILEKYGVPKRAVRPYGRSVISTIQEAEALARTLGGEPMTLLVVTSPYHVRRAKLIFQRALPKCRIVAVGTPYESFPANWWTDQRHALAVVKETAKLAFYLAGGAFRSKTMDAAGQNQPAPLPTGSGQ